MFHNSSCFVSPCIMLFWQIVSDAKKNFCDDLFYVHQSKSSASLFEPHFLMQENKEWFMSEIRAFFILQNCIFVYFWILIRKRPQAKECSSKESLLQVKKNPLNAESLNVANPDTKTYNLSSREIFWTCLNVPKKIFWVAPILSEADKNRLQISLSNWSLTLPNSYNYELIIKASIKMWIMSRFLNFLLSLELFFWQNW